MKKGILTIIAEIKKDIEQKRARIKSEINSVSPIWSSVFKENNRENAFEFTLALYYGNEKLARRMTTFYINKYAKSAPANNIVKQPAKVKSTGVNRITERWLHPDNVINKRTQLFNSPCNTCPVQTTCARTKTLLLQCECNVIKGHKVSVLQSFMFVDSKLPKKLMEDIKKTIVFKGETERWTDKWQYNN